MYNWGKCELIKLKVTTGHQYYMYARSRDEKSTETRQYSEWENIRNSILIPTLFDYNTVWNVRMGTRYSTLHANVSSYLVHMYLSQWTHALLAL